MVVALRESGKNSEEERQRIIAETMKKLENEKFPSIRAQACADTIRLVLAFLHIDRGHTGKWLRQFLQDFNRFGDDVNIFSRVQKERIQAEEELDKILLEECDFDIKHEFELCEQDSRRRGA